METPRNARLLILSYHFPPSAEVAGKPTARLVRHLPSYGWDVIVMTIPIRQIYGAIDHHGCRDVLEATRVERVTRWPWLVDTARGISRISRLMRRAPGIDPIGRPQVDIAIRRRGLRERVFSYFAFPDVWAGWVIPAVIHGCKLLRREQFDAVLSVSPSSASMLAGLALRWLHPSLPWLAQFHDPWVDNPSAKPVDAVLRHALRALERNVVQSADEVLLATQETADAFKARYPEMSPGKFGVLANGYDPVDFSNVAAGSTAPGRPLRLVYTGNLYSSRDPFPLLRGIADMVSRGTLMREAVRVELIGDCEQANGVSVRQVADSLGLGEVVDITGPVSYPEALRRMAGADVLLLFAQGQPDQIPAKLYEYLHIGRYILGFTSGASARVIRETGAGRVVETTAEITAALEEIADLHRTGDLSGHSVANTKLRQYHAAHLAEVLAAKLNALVRKSHRQTAFARREFA